MKKLRIAFYTDSYLPALDGVVNYVIKTRQELERRGHEVKIFTSGNKDTAALAEEDPSVVVFTGISFRRYRQYTIAVKPHFQREVSEFAPHIIHSHTPFSMGLLAVRARNFTGAKLVSTYHTNVFSDNLLSDYLSSNSVVFGVSKAILHRYLRWLYRKSDRVLAATQYILRILAREGIKNTSLVPVGTDVKHVGKIITKIESRRKLGLPAKDRIIEYLGRIGAEKNIGFIVRAGKKLESAGFSTVIAGSGPELQTYIDLSKRMGLNNTRFPGFVTEEAKKYYYSSADVFCNPSLFETQSLVDVEAMSYGVPILVPKGSAQAEFLWRGKCGEAYKPESVKDFVGKALKMAKNPQDYRPRYVAKEFSVKNTTDVLLEAYSSVLEGNH